MEMMECANGAVTVPPEDANVSLFSYCQKFWRGKKGYGRPKLAYKFSGVHYCV